MNLFINAVSESWVFIIFNSDRKIIARENIQVLGNESSKLIWLLDSFLSANNISYYDLENIVVVSGPGSFTGIRTISLIVNTINYVIKKNITDINYFDLFKNYPICKPSSKRDTFIKKWQDYDIEVIQNPDLINYFDLNNISEIYWELNPTFFDKIKALDEIDYESIIWEIKFKKNSQIRPLYIKKPSIT